MAISVISANVTARGVTIRIKQEGNLVEYNSVASAGSNFSSLMVDNLFQEYLSTLQIEKSFLV